MNLNLKRKLKCLQKERRAETAAHNIKMSQLRVREFQILQKENKLNNQILIREEQIRKAISAEKDFNTGVTEINIFLKTKTLAAQANVQELKRIK